MPPRDTGIQAHRDEGRRLFGLGSGWLSRRGPDYPEAVYETLVKRCGLGPTARVLEIGPGTGLVTRHLLRQGAHVTAVEPGCHGISSCLFEAAASAYLNVVISSFEDSDVAPGRFRSGRSRHLVSLGQPGGWSDKTGASH